MIYHSNINFKYLLEIRGSENTPISISDTLNNSKKVKKNKDPKNMLKDILLRHVRDAMIFVSAKKIKSQ